MKCSMKMFVSLLATITMLFVLSACGLSLQKPTGLEKQENEQQEFLDDEQIEESTEEDIGATEEVKMPETVALDSDQDEEKDEEKSIEVESKAKGNEIAKKEKSSSNNNGQESASKKTSKKTMGKSLESSEAGVEQASQPVEDNKKAPLTSKPAVPNPTQTPTKKTTEIEVEPEQQSNTLVYSIVISSSEVPLPPTEMEIKDGDTVLQALIEITKKHKIQMDYRGGQGATAYVEGIDNVYEFDRGQGSGWMYRVNGIFPDRGAGVVPLLAGDRVEWLYTTNLGVDLGADLKPFRR